MAKSKVMFTEKELQPFKMKDGMLQVKGKHIEEGMKTLFRMAGQLQSASRENSVIIGYEDEQVAEAIDYLRRNENDPRESERR